MCPLRVVGRRILVVDEDAQVLKEVSQHFTDEGFQVSIATGGAELRQQLAIGDISVVVLELGILGEDGFQLTREVRAHSPTIGLLIYTTRGETMDRVIGLELGADDYVVKPVHYRELLARVKSVLRRRHPVDAAPPEEITGDLVFIFDDWQFNSARRQLTDPSGKDVPLTTGEFDLVRVLVENAGRVLTRDRIMDLTKGRDWDGLDRTVDAQIVRLRKKIERDPKHPLIIRSVRGAGYVFAAKMNRVFAR